MGTDSRGAAALACALALGCTGIAYDPATTLIPDGTHEVSDVPLCPFEAPAPAPGPTWTRAGPPGASVQALLALGQGTVLVGTGSARSTGLLSTQLGGLFRSTDGGKTVTRAQSLAATRVNQLVAAADGTVYAAVGSLSGSADDGVWTSSDRGATWTRLNAGLHAGARVVRLAVAAGTPTRLYALVSGTATNPLSVAVTLYRKDGAADWVATALTGVNIVPGGPLGAIAADPAQRDRLYAIDGARLYVSADAGETFSTVAQGWLGAPRRLWVPAAGRLLLGTASDGLFESTDDGVTWVSRLVAVNGEQPGVLDAAPSGVALFVATEGGGLQRVEGGQARVVGKCVLDAVVLSVAAAPDDATAVWVGTNGGLAVSDNAGESFLPAGAGLDEVLGRFRVAPFDDGPTLFLLSSAGLFYYSTTSQKWQRQGDWASTVAFSDVAMAPDGKNGLLAVDETLFPGRYGIPGGLWRWKRAERTVAQLPELEADVGAAAFDPSQPARAFAYQRGAVSLPQRARTGVYARPSLDAPFAQTAVLGEHLEGTVTFRFSPLAVAPDGTVYAGVRLPDASPALVRSDDAGAARTQVWNQPGWVAYGVYVDAAGAVYVTGSMGNVAVRKSTDRGATFTQFDDGLTGFGKFVYTLAFDGAGGIVVGTEDGVHHAADGARFAAINDGLAPRTAVWSVAVLPATPRPIVVAATNRGLYWRTLP